MIYNGISQYSACNGGHWEETHILSSHIIEETMIINIMRL